MADQDRDRRSTVYVPWTPGIQPTWTVAQIRSALTLHEQGQFSSSAKLIRAMGRDDRIEAVLSTRVGGLFGREFSVNPAGDEPSPGAVTMAEAMETDWWQMCPEAELAELLRWYVMAGGGLAELQWRRDAGKWTPHLHTWDLQHLYWQEQADQTEEGHLDLMTRQGTIRIEPGDGKWLLLADGLRWWHNGAVRSLAVPWIVRQFAIRDWARLSERLGQPLLLAKIPAMVEAEDKGQFFTDLQALSTETTVTLPQGVGPSGESFDLTLLEASGENWEGFKGLIDQCADMFAVRLLGHNLTTEVRGGSFAAAQTGQDVRDDVRRSDAQMLTTTLRTQFLEPLRAYQYGGTPDDTPWPHYDVDPPADLAGKATAIETLGRGLGALDQAGFEVANLDELAEVYGLELVKVPKPIPPPSPFGFQPGGPGAPKAEADEADDEEHEQPEDEAEELHEQADIDDEGRARRALRAGELVSITPKGYEVIMGRRWGMRAEPTDEVRLASGDAIDTARGFLDGQLAVDRIAAVGERRSRAALAPTVRAVMAIVDEAPSLDNGQPDMAWIKQRLLDAYERMTPPTELVEWLERAIMLAEIKGRAAVVEDL